MQPTEPSGYENEPVERFDPLPPERYPEFFALETRSLEDDCRFYHQLLTSHLCSTVLELGCGIGRVQEYLHRRSGLKTVGIDLSLPMLQHAHAVRQAPRLQMDMLKLGFKNVFEAVLVPYNTLNLLAEIPQIQYCLGEISRVLKPSGLLLLHLYCPTDELLAQPERRHFQFALFDSDDNTKLIKETIRIYHPESSTLSLEERYKLRSFRHPSENRNYSQHLTLAAPPRQTWNHLLTQAGFQRVNTWSDFKESPYRPDSSTLIIHAKKLGSGLGVLLFLKKK